MAAVPRESRAGGDIVFMAEVDLLLAGDIILTRNRAGARRKGVKQSGAIAAATGGTFSHAMICVGPPTCVEAVATGVAMLSLGRSFAHDLSNVRVLRHPDRALAGRAAELARLEVGRDYSSKKAVASVFPMRTLQSTLDHGVFCSALVAQAYASAGCALCDTPVDRTTPATIEGLRHLDDVTASLFRPLVRPGNLESMSALDGERVPTGSARQTEISNRCARIFFDDASRLAASVPDLNLEPVPSLNGLLDFVRQAIDCADKMPTEARSRLSTLDKSLAAFIEEGELGAMLRDVMGVDDNEIMKTLDESFRPEPDIDVDAMRSYLAVSRAQLVARRSAIKGLRTWGVERSAAFSAYLPLDVASADAVQRRVTILEEVLRRMGVDTPSPTIRPGADA